MLLGLALVASMMMLSGSICGADYDLQKTPSSLKAPLETISSKRVATAELATAPQAGKVYYLLGNLDKVRGTVTTDAGAQETSFQGEVGFQVVPDKDGQMTFILESFNLVSPGVQTKKGDSGVIGINLADAGSKASYDAKTGNTVAEIRTILHYDLIDEVMGFIREKSDECAVFNSYTEDMAGTLQIKLPESLKATDQGEVSINGVVRLELKTPVVGAIQNTLIYIDASKLIWYLTRPAQILNVQPVYIGTGSGDPAATGVAFNTLINRAAEIWNRCGTVRCIALRANQPIYLNNNAYRLLTNADADPAEAAALRAEVNVPDAVEVFVVERWEPLFDGGGACWASGTASAKIITCDLQLNVPCPPPCGSGSCGAVNLFHLGHELGHSLTLGHPGSPGSLIAGTVGSLMEPSGFCLDNPNVQSARNCRSATSPLLYWGRSICTKSPNIMD